MLESRRGTLVAIGSGVVAAGAIGGLGASFAMNRPSIGAVFPAPDGAVASTRAILTATIDNPGRMNGLRATLDGNDVTSAVRANRGRLVILPKAALKEGAHQANITFHSDNPLARTVSRSWRFAVDTEPPALKLAASAGTSTKRKVALAGSTDPGARVRVSWPKGNLETTAGPTGVWNLTARLPEGESPVRFLARDLAGNARIVTRPVVVDTLPPRLSVTPLASGTLRTDRPVVVGRVVGDTPGKVTYGGTINGRPFGPVSGASATAISGTDGTLVSEAIPGTIPLQVAGSRFRLALPALSEGRNRISLFVRDGVGNRSTSRLTAVVDSSDEFGEHPILTGAKGGDVRGLQERLKEARVFRGSPTGRFDARTLKSVRAYQRKFGIPVTGDVNPITLRKMVGRIVVSVKNRKLRLIRNGKVVRTYSVAVGQPAYPTPIGRFSIVVKLPNPTWTPPNSPWAKGLGPIPPGPGNPLGTRWIGTSASSVGIHGTYADGSIGSAASHGCIRMHIPDVEKLYEQVTVGMPVDIVA